MELSVLKEVLSKRYEKSEIEQKGSIICTKDYLVDIEKYKEQLGGSDGNALEQIKEINSSAALAVYYHIMLNPQELCFEEKVAVPLSGSSRKANLDVMYKEGEEAVYVESKFLEPYYSSNEDIIESYLNKERYPEMDENKRNSWQRLIKDSRKYRYYNFTQLCRHLMAIYRWKEEKGIKSPIKLICLSWDATDSFKSFLEECTSRRSLSYFNKRQTIIHDESEKVKQRIMDFLNEIEWDNMTFETKTYNDEEVIKKIEGHPKFAEFKKRYFLD